MEEPISGGPYIRKGLYSEEPTSGRAYIRRGLYPEGLASEIKNMFACSQIVGETLNDELNKVNKWTFSNF